MQDQTIRSWPLRQLQWLNKNCKTS